MMKTHPISIPWSMLGVGIMCGALVLPIAKADDDPELTRPSLKGLRWIRVSIRLASTNDLKGFGVTEDTLRTDVELKLREAGLPITSDADVLKRGGAFLCVVLTVVSPKEAEGSAFAYNLEVHVEQPASLMRDPSIIDPLAVTWSTGVTGFLGGERIRAIRDTLGDLTNKFLNAYLSVNPR
jgi:hypothetical protein